MRSLPGVQLVNWLLFILATYRDLKDELVAAIVGLESVKNRRKLVGIEFY